MKSKRLTWAALVLTVLLVLPGCSQNQQVIFDAAMKMQDVHSLQQQTTMSFQLSGSDFEPSVQQQISTAAMFLNNAKLDINAKTSGNTEKTVVKAQVDMNLALQGMTINMPMWVDSDLTGDTPKITEIIRLPQIAQASLPPQFASKEYMVMDPSEMTNSELSSMDMLKLTEFSRNFQATEVAFLTSYAERFKPEVNVQSGGTKTIQTNDGLKEAQIYKIKLNDAQFKDFIRYTVNNFTKDTEAMKFVKEFMDSILEISQVPDKANAIIEFDKAFEEFDANKSQFLAEFNAIMDQLDEVTFLGDKGLELNYAISNGYCIQKSGTVNLKIDIEQMNKLMNTLNEQQSTSVDAKGTLDLLINFKTDNFGINSPLEIKIPEVNSTNSFNYMDLMNSMTPVGSGQARLAGQDRFQTARTIGEDYNSGKCTSIILASGNNFPDALSSNILSKKFAAPVLLVGDTVEQSAEALSYIAAHSYPDTKIYIIGGTGIIGASFETELIKGGHINIERLSGYDRYDTAMAVVDKANVNSGTPVIVASGENFPDALGVSSFSGSNQYPTLLVGQNYLSDKTKNYLTSNKPTTVYIVGGVFVVSQAVEAQIKELVPTAVIKRLAGNDRFDTVAAVINEFSASPRTLFLANGFNFPDALAGSALAAKTGDPVLLIDNNGGTLPPAVEAYLKKLRAAGSRPIVRALGGTAVVSDTLIRQAENVLDGK